MDELHMDPFERWIAGLRGTVLVRRHRQHVDHCRTVIARREHPAWSSQDTTFEVREAA